MKLLTPSHANAKTAKNDQFSEYISYILHLAPSKLSGYNVCPKASQGCAAACLNTAGRGQFKSIQSARINKTLRLFNDKDNFLADLYKDLQSVSRKATKLNKRAVVRLNGTSDISWEFIRSISLGTDNLNIFELFPNIQFYDYTKVFRRLEHFKKHITPNYHLTFSSSETNWPECLKALELGYAVAVVFNEIPLEYMGYPVINGDNHDLRFLDSTNKIGGYIVGLKAKGRAKRDNSGFVKYISK